MKHYTDEKGWEWDAHFKEGRDNWSNKRNISRAKHGYRRRERAALKRQTRNEVEVELSGYTDAERAYWLRELEGAVIDYDDLWYAEEYLRESGQWNEDHTRIFAVAYREVRNRSEAAYGEWFAAA